MISLSTYLRHIGTYFALAENDVTTKSNRVLVYLVDLYIDPNNFRQRQKVPKFQFVMNGPKMRVGI